MRLYTRLILILFINLWVGNRMAAQSPVDGRIIDAGTNEPIPGATIRCTIQNCKCGCTSMASGEFRLDCNNCDSLVVSSVGYLSRVVHVNNASLIFLSASAVGMKEVVVTASRGEVVKRTEAPVAIALINAKVIQDTKATGIEQLLNKVSGVNMVSLGNEQHSMSIRQPMTTKSLFLYLEDGIPIRTSGFFNHNALIEINMTAVKNIEVIKGPSSSLYGSEAIGGVVNFISLSPSVIPVARLSQQVGSNGYRRTDLLASHSRGRSGVLIAGYYADKRQGLPRYNDFHKAAISLKTEHRFGDKATLTTAVSMINYYSDMPGGIDSAMFADRQIKNLHSFTFRKVNSLRFHSTLVHKWNEKNKTTITGLFRSNKIGQNPAYRVRDDYRRVNGVFTGRKDLAHGEINENDFNSYSLLIQHRHLMTWLNGSLTAGLSFDLSPSAYEAKYIRISRDSVTKKYLDFQASDSLLSSYDTRLLNYSGYLNFEFKATPKLRVVLSARYDHFNYGFSNHLQPSAFSGAPDTRNCFGKLSLKTGLTYNFTDRLGLYANYSEGFVPPQVTELYTGVRVPDLEPSIFRNLEAGGWMEIIKNRLSADLSLYRLHGANEIVNVKLDDGSFANQNAGKTLHQGIEAALNLLIPDFSFRLGGAFSDHEFVRYSEKGVSFNGKKMNNAPRWVYNTETWYRPAWIKGLRIGLEWQHIGKYFTDPLNTDAYEGYDVFNLRTAYKFKFAEIWFHILNLGDKYYSTLTSKSAFGYSYQVAEQRNFLGGISLDIAHILKRNK